MVHQLELHLPIDSREVAMPIQHQYTPSHTLRHDTVVAACHLHFQYGLELLQFVYLLLHSLWILQQSSRDVQNLLHTQHTVQYTLDQ